VYIQGTSQPRYVNRKGKEGNSVNGKKSERGKKIAHDYKQALAGEEGFYLVCQVDLHFGMRRSWEGTSKETLK